MTRVLDYARTCFVGGTYRPTPPGTLSDEVLGFHAVLEDLAALLNSGTPLRDVTEEQLLQGPFCDAMTHAGQLAVLRRLAGVPIAPESFIDAGIQRGRLGPDQPEPMSPDPDWPEQLP